MNSSSFKISVTKPCHELWENMLPDDKGRFCRHCSTSVIDFTTYSDEAIKHFFINNQLQPVCGRFKTGQIQRIRIVLPNYILKKKLPAWKKYLVILLLCFSYTLFPFETVLGQPQQKQQIVSTSKKKRKKKLKFRMPTIQWQGVIEQSITTDMVQVLGFTVPVNESLETIKLYTPPSSKDSINATLKSNNKLPFKKKGPGRNFPANKTEFILPVTIKKRRRKNL